MEKQYIAIDLKSFYASVECRERGLDPLVAKLVVADKDRTSKTICLAVSPALKAYGIPGRARLFEVEQKIKEIKRQTGQTIDFIIAKPRMRKYIEYSAKIYSIYLKYIAPEDIHVYSIDEVFIDATSYLKTYKMSAKDLAMRMISDILSDTGITATAGIGTNLYLAKIAMDIVAKHIPADENGVRIASLNEQSYKLKLWNHKPLTDFWRLGMGYAKKLNSNGMYTMGDVARCAIVNEELLYKLFGINAELLIDHAFGIEPCTIADIKKYKPENNSLSSGQVLHCPYDFEKARLIVKEMTDDLVLELAKKNLVTNQLVLTIGYDTSNITDGKKYTGKIKIDHYGRKIPEHAHGSTNLDDYTSSTKKILESVLKLYDEIVDKSLLIRRINVTSNHVLSADDDSLLKENETFTQLSLFDNFEKDEEKKKKEKENEEKEKKIQDAIIKIQERYGKNALLKGMNLEEGAMTINRNSQIGGHNA